jgi:tight adherence protein B
VTAAAISIGSGVIAVVLMAAAVIVPASRRHADRKRWRLRRVATAATARDKPLRRPRGRHSHGRHGGTGAGPGAPVLAPGPGRPLPTASLARLTGLALRAWRHRRMSVWGPAALGATTGAIGLVSAGPVLAVVLVAYGAAGAVVLRGAAIRRSQEQGVRLAADAVLGLAADLRAGVAMGPALQAAEAALRRAAGAELPAWRSRRRSQRSPDDAADGVLAVVRRVESAVNLAQASGAPLADLLDRLDAHLRAGQRTRAMAQAQAAGAHASAAILAAMPIAGVGLGVMVGTDPWRVLLHTLAGGMALCAAVALQLAGLVWTARLARIEVLP